MVSYIPSQNRSNLRFEKFGNNYSLKPFRLKNDEEKNKIKSQLNQEMLPVYGQCLRPYKNIFRNICSDCNWTRTHNHLVHKRTLNHLAKLAR